MLKYLLINYEISDIHVLLAHLFILLVFSVIYKNNSDLFIGHIEGHIDDEVKDRKDVYNNLYDGTYLNSLYFSAIVHTTVGFGRIYPVNNKARIIVFTHLMIVLSLVIITRR